MPTHAIMVLGTHSIAGKSLVTTAFCRVLARQGVRVAPFKAQNMSNNAGVTPEGGEMGRAQIVQAEAAGIAPHTDMNPVLLKPEANRRSQIILNGEAVGHIEAANWFEIKRMLWDEVRGAYDRLASRYDAIILEGAGSPAEINLQRGDIVNLGMARYANAPCLLVGDIDRGGVFAALAGTMHLLEPEERAQIKGFLINKFRGDPALLGDINGYFQERAYGVPTLGVIPHIPNLHIADEDAVALDRDQRPSSQSTDDAALRIAVIKLPHIANFDEFDALALEPGVALHYVESADELSGAHAVILPGTKVTISDLAWMRERDLDNAVQQVAARRGSVVGICGGFQMLGARLADPHGVENTAGAEIAGLGLLAVETVFQPHKQTHRARMRLCEGDEVSGYEIHSGETTLNDDAAPFGEIIWRERNAVSILDGARSEDGRIWGCYLHGIFENDTFRHRWLRTLGWTGEGRSTLNRDAEYDRLADIVESNVGWKAIEALLWGR